MKSLLLASVALVATASATTVFAADLIIEEPVAIVDVASTDWTGPYVGVFAGAGSGTVDWASLPTGALSGDYDASGWLLGVRAGYNWQADSVVYGIEADIAWADISGEDEDFAPDAVTRSIDWTGSLRGRLGFAVESLLLYGTAGVAAAGSSAEVFGNEDSATHFGWTAGIGAEYLITDDISLTAEYRYTSYGSQDYDFNFIDIETEFDTHTFTLGLNFQF